MAGNAGAIPGEDLHFSDMKLAPIRACAGQVDCFLKSLEVHPTFFFPLTKKIWMLLFV
jgi:hypothetical protein